MLVLSSLSILFPKPKFPTQRSLLFFSVLNKENCVKKFPSSVLAISLTAKILKSGELFSLRSILTSVSPSPGIKFEIYSDTEFERAWVVRVI